jgi:hypothetical protein
MTNDKLKINFPLNGGDVFDKNNSELFFTYSGAFSNTTNNLDDLSFKQFEENIPMGYKTILVCRRIKLIDLGISVEDFNFSEGEKFILLTNNNYSLYVPNWKRDIETATIFKPNYPDLSVTSFMWDNIYECCKYGLEYSKTNKCMVAVASVLDIINWH